MKGIVIGHNSTGLHSSATSSSCSTITKTPCSGAIKTSTRQRTLTSRICDHYRAGRCMLYCCADSRLYALYLEKAKKIFANAMMLGQISISQSVRVSVHGYPPQTGSGGKATHNPRYIIYFVPFQSVFKDAVLFAQELSLSHGPALCQKSRHLALHTL